MAYENIYQISPHPITPDDYIGEEQFYDNFVGRYASHVEESKDRQTDIKALKKELGAAVEWNDNSFKIVDKNEFFRGKRIRFNDAVERLSLYELDEFSGNEPSDIDFAMFSLNQYYSNECGTYVYDELNSTRTIDQFMRQANTDETWYVGNVIKYHY